MPATDAPGFSGAGRQNAALVEEMAAAASSLHGQAQELVQAVSVFKLQHGAGVQATMPRAAPAPSATPMRALSKPQAVGEPVGAKKVAPVISAPKPAAPIGRQGRWGLGDFLSKSWQGPLNDQPQRP